MSFLTVLGLAAPTSLAIQPAPLGRGSTTAQAGGAQAAPKRTRMAKLTVDRAKRDLWGLLDKDGRVAQGGGKSPLNTLSDLNRAAVEIWKFNEQTLIVREADWPEGAKTVRGHAAAAAKVLKSLPKLKETIKSARDDKSKGNFFQAVNDYLKAAGEAKLVVGEINSAELAFQKARAELDTALDLKTYEEAKDDVADKKAALEKKKKELEEAKAIFDTVLSIGKQVVSADWKGLAERAIGYVKDKAEDAVRDAVVGPLFEVDIAKLTKALDDAEKKLAMAKAQWLADNVRAATLGMRKAASDFDNARARLGERLKDLARNQGNAVGALKKDERTRPVGELIQKRVAQFAAIGEARERIHSYFRAAETFAALSARLKADYAQLGSTISRLPKDEAVYRRDTAWGKEADFVTAANSVLLGDLENWVNGVISRANAELRYFDDAGAQGPFAPFDQALAQVETGLAAM